MKKFLIVYIYFGSRIHGSISYASDIYMQLYDNNVNVYMMTNDHEKCKNFFRGRFGEMSYKLRFIDNIIFDCNDISFSYISYTFLYNKIDIGVKKMNKIIDNCKNIFLICSGGLYKEISHFINQNIDNNGFLIKNLKKIKILEDPILKVEDLDRIPRINNILSWGIYKNININKEYKKINNWLIYSRDDIGATDQKVLSKALKYSEEKKIDLTYDFELQKSNIYDPWNHFDGLLYTKEKEFSGRLPFEFSLANKPTVFFNITNYHSKIIDNIILNKEIIIKNIPCIEIDYDFFKGDHI